MTAVWSCPKHTFYVDNLFVFEPLPYVKNLYYLDVNFYRYFIGRDDQSVNEKVMIKRIDQQIRVNKLMVDAYIGCGHKPASESIYVQLSGYYYNNLIYHAYQGKYRGISAEKERASGIY